MSELEQDLLESSIELIQEGKYGAAAKQLGKIDESQLQAECERLNELVGNHSEMLGGKLGEVISNYEDRLIDELAQKAYKEGDME